MVAAYIRKIMHDTICMTDVYLKEVINMFSEVSWLVENVNIGMYSKHHKFHLSQCPTLHGGTRYGALPVHTTFSDLTTF